MRECVDAENFRVLWLVSAYSALEEQTRDGGAHKDGAARYKNRIQKVRYGKNGL